jgi:tetratricopeptide (TPR) repeat protein
VGNLRHQDLTADSISCLAKNQGEEARAPIDKRLAWRRAVCVVALLLIGAGWAGDALAAGAKSSAKSKAAAESPATPPKADLVAAKQAYEEALRAFNLGQWDEAIAGFQKSYKLSGDATLLFNVAQAHRQAGHVKEAIIAYKAFLREKPDTPHREMIEAKLKELESATESKTAAEKPTSSPAQPDRLTGIWEDPFAERPGAQPGSAIAPPAPAALSPPAPRVAPVAPVAGPSVAEPVLSSPPPPVVKQEPAVQPEALDLHQKPASQESTAAPASSSNWWLWTGIGVVVAGGVVTAILLSTRSPGRDGACPSGLDDCIAVRK